MPQASDQPTAVTRSGPSRATRFAAWYRAKPVGTVRSVIVAVLVGTLIAGLFVQPPSRNAAAENGLQVLVVAVVAFFYGSVKRRETVENSKAL